MQVICSYRVILFVLGGSMLSIFFPYMMQVGRILCVELNVCLFC